MGRSRNSARKLSQKVVLGALISAVVLAPTRPGSANEGGSSWTSTGSLNTASAFHRATLLPNGKVLVVRGVAELYDPQTGTWNYTGNLNMSHAGLAATLLGNGTPELPHLITAGFGALVLPPLTLNVKEPVLLPTVTTSRPG